MLVEGPLNNLQPSMIQFSKPRRPLDKPDRFGFGVRETLNGGLAAAEARRAEVAARLDNPYYSAVGSIPSDAQSVHSQATYNSGLPSFGPGQFSGRSYASCKSFNQSQGGKFRPNIRSCSVSITSSATISQDLMSQDPAMADDASSIAGSIAFSQADRLGRGLGQYNADYKSIPQDDDARSQVSLSTQITDF